MSSVEVYTVPAVAVAGEPETFAITNLVDEQSIPPEFYGVTSYASPTAVAPRVSRREAMQVPAVKRARDLIAGSIGMLPLVTVKPDLTIDRASWLTQPEADVPRSVTMTRTAEDLLFEGIAWWRITRFDWSGFPSQVVRLEPRTVDVLPEGRVEVTSDGHRGIYERHRADRELIRFDSPNDPLLVAGARAIRQYLLLAQAAQRHAEGIPPVDYFTPTDGVEPAPPPGMSQDDYVRAILDGWAAARRARSTGYVPGSLTYNGNQFDAAKLQLAEQINHAVLEIARVAGIDSEEVGVSTTSRTYANQFDRRKAFLDFTQGGYRMALQDRLSMNDVTARGTSTRFELDEFLRSDPAARFASYKAGLEVGAIDPDEIRPAEGKPQIAKAATPEVPA